MVRILATFLMLTASFSPLQAQEETPETWHSEFDIVLVHGLGSSADVWNDITTPLNLAFNVWPFEMPGHGETQPVADASIASFADLLGAYISENDIRNPVLVGHGLGAMVAMTYAFEHPAKVSRLVIIDATPKQLASNEQKAAVAEQLLNNYDRFVAGYYMNMSPRENVNEQVLDQALRTDKITFQQLMMSSFDFDLTEDLAYQAIPILLIGSGMMFPDPTYAQEQLDPMGFVNARSVSFKTMPELGHYVMLEEAHYTASVIIAFSRLWD